MPKTLGSRLQEARKAKGLSVRELGELSQVSYKSIYYYESDKGWPVLFTVLCLAKALDVSIDWLVGRNEIK